MIKIKKYSKFIFIKKFIPLLQKKYPNKTNKEIELGIKKLLKNNKYILLVAFDDAKPIAIAGLNFNYLLCSGSFVQVSNIFVLEEYRKTGVASKLLEKVEDIARNKKIKNLSLFSYIENDEAKEHYAKNNFSITANYFSKIL